MGPNGQAQYWAPTSPPRAASCLAYYEHSYVAPGERFPRRAPRPIPSTATSASPHDAPGRDFARVGDMFSDAYQPRAQEAVRHPLGDGCRDRRGPSAARALGRRCATPRSRVVWDAHLGGWPVAMIGIESTPCIGTAIPADGPEQWTSGTLFPRSSKKIARAINAAGGNRPLVVLANLVGFDGSPESMRDWQLEFGAEIGRAVVNFKGPIVFCVVSRYHGGAFVVFSSPQRQPGSGGAGRAYASVIGGAPAAAVASRARSAAGPAGPADRRARRAHRARRRSERQRLRAERAALWSEVRSEKRGEFAASSTVCTASSERYAWTR